LDEAPRSDEIQVLEPIEERKLDRLFRLYYAGLFQTIAIVLGLGIVSIQLIYYLIATNAHGNVALEVFFCLVSVGISAYSARYVGAFLQLEVVMERLHVMEIDKEILELVDPFFVWKASTEEPTAQGRIARQKTAYAWQIGTWIVVGSVYSTIFAALTAWYWGLLLLLVIAGAAVALYLVRQHERIQSQWVRDSQ
jgi:hypothetical protein